MIKKIPNLYYVWNVLILATHLIPLLISSILNLTGVVAAKYVLSIFALFSPLSSEILAGVHGPVQPSFLVGIFVVSIFFLVFFFKPEIKARFFTTKISLLDMYPLYVFAFLVVSIINFINNGINLGSGLPVYGTIVSLAPFLIFLVTFLFYVNKKISKP